MSPLSTSRALIAPSAGGPLRGRVARAQMQARRAGFQRARRGTGAAASSARVLWRAAGSRRRSPEPLHGRDELT
eukprot:5275547-Prymnesium_polylepis.1